MVSYKKLVSIYLPEELYQALTAYQEQRGFEETSGVLIEILAQFFHKDGGTKCYATVEQLEAVEGKVTYLSQQVAQLSQVIASTTPTEVDKTISALGSEDIRATLAPQSSSFAFGSTLLEEEEDEPDEILYDFLEPGSPSSR